MIITSRLQLDLLTNPLDPCFASEVHVPDEILPGVAIHSYRCIDEILVVRVGEIALRRELHKQIINREPVGRFRQTEHSAMAAPCVVFGSSDHPRPPRIECVISKDIERVRLLLHQPAIKATLIEMSNASITAIEITGIFGIEPSHSDG